MTDVYRTPGCRRRPTRDEIADEVGDVLWHMGVDDDAGGAYRIADAMVALLWPTHDSAGKMARRKGKVHASDCLHREGGVTICTCIPITTEQESA